MSKPERKILHLVLYNPTPQYQQMYDITRRWYEEVIKLGVDTFYYFYDPDVESPTIDESKMTLRLPGTESYYPGILAKTLEALEFFTRDGYAFVVRSNISTPVNFYNLIGLLPPRPPTMLYGGPHLINPSLVVTQCENDLFASLKPMKFVHGTCIVFGPDAVRFLLAHRSEICTTIEDDFALGVLFKQHAIIPTQLGGQYAFFGLKHNINNATTFRNHDVGSDRKRDIDAIAFQVNALMDRYCFLGTPQQVTNVLYHDKDVTLAVVALCSQKPWTTDQNNMLLDQVFGDPCPNVAKHLTTKFKHDTRVLTQRCNLTFEVKKDGNLWVY